MRRSLVINIPEELWEQLQKIGFAKGSHASTLTSQWVSRHLRESVTKYTQAYKNSKETEHDQRL